MPTAQSVYQENVLALPSEERLRLAALILRELTEPAPTEPVILVTPPVGSGNQTLHIRSPRFVNSQDALHCVKHIVEADDADL